MKDRIKQIRINSNLNQTEFGERVGATFSTVSGWESGRRTPTEISIKAICREFNVNYPWLVEGIGNMYSSSTGIVAELCKELNVTDPREILIIETFCKMDAEERRQFIDTCKKLLSVK